MGLAKPHTVVLGGPNINKESKPLPYNTFESVIDLVSFTEIPQLLFFFAFFVQIKGALNLVFGDGTLAYLSYEIIQKKCAKIIDHDRLPIEVVFPNSYYIYYPAWANALEKRGVRISLLYYSLNCLPITISGKYCSEYFGYMKLTWPRHLMFDMCISNFIKKNSIRELKFEKIPPVVLNTEKMPSTLDSNSIAVFDVNPIRPLFYASNAHSLEYYNAELTRNFYQHLAYIAEKYEITLIIKQKRAQSLVVASSFPGLLERLSINRRFKVLNPNVSPIEIIKKTRGTIAMPFTSPALIAKQFKKPSIFYDASGRISQKDVGEVPLANSLIPLCAWVELVLKSQSINHKVKDIE